MALNFFFKVLYLRQVKMALNLAREHRTKSSTKTNQQSVAQTSGYDWMITIFKLNSKVSKRILNYSPFEKYSRVI